MEILFLWKYLPEPCYLDQVVEMILDPRWWHRVVVIMSLNMDKRALHMLTWGYFAERDPPLCSSQLSTTEGYVLRIVVEGFARLVKRYEFS